MTKNHNLLELSDTVRRMFSLMMVFAVTAACTLSCWSNELMECFYVDHSVAYAAVFCVLVFCIIPISITYIFGTLLTAAGKLRELNVFAACSLILNVLLNILFIPWLGVVGSAYAALTAQCFMAVAQMVAALRIFSMHPTRGYIFRLFFFVLCVVACTFFMPHLTGLLPLLVVGFVAVGLAWVLGLLEINEIMKLVK